MKNKLKEYNEWFWDNFNQGINFGDYLRNAQNYIEKKDIRKNKIKRLFN